VLRHCSYLILRFIIICPPKLILGKGSAKEQKMNLVFDQLKREMEQRAHLYLILLFKVLFVDNAKNAAVKLGDRDIKSDDRVTNQWER
jgi:hypothetical protein